MNIPLLILLILEFVLTSYADTFTSFLQDSDDTEFYEGETDLDEIDIDAISIETLWDSIDVVPEREDYEALVGNPEFDDSIPVYSSVLPSEVISGILSEDIGGIELSRIVPEDDVEVSEYYELDELDSDAELLEDLEDYENPAVYISVEES